MERGGLLTWLEWLVGSCAIICGGALTAEICHGKMDCMDFIVDQIAVSNKVALSCKIIFQFNKNQRYKHKKCKYS